MATVYEVKHLANFQQFLEDTDTDSAHGECHTALTWLAIQIKKAGLPCANVWLCNGTFARYDHSWMLIEDEDMNKQTIIDLTVQQFGWPRDPPYIGPVSPGYECYEKVSLDDEAALPDFINSLG